MAHTDIKISSEGDIFVPSQSSVPVNKGDTIAFSTAETGGVMLFFSPDAAAILSPAPTQPVSLAQGATTSFSFTSSEPGAYSIYFGRDASSTPASFRATSSQMLMLEVALDQVGFSAVGTGGPKTGLVTDQN